MVEKDNPKLSIGKQCKLLSISRSSFYYQPKGETALNLMTKRARSTHPGLPALEEAPVSKVPQQCHVVAPVPRLIR